MQERSDPLGSCTITNGRSTKGLAVVLVDGGDHFHATLTPRQAHDLGEALIRVAAVAFEQQHEDWLASKDTP
jgi:hypothetical protein